jgi:hypothetical protein
MRCEVRCAPFPLPNSALSDLVGLLGFSNGSGLKLPELSAFL